MPLYTFEQFNRTFIAKFSVNIRKKISLDDEISVSLHDMAKDSLVYIKDQVPVDVVFSTARKNVSNELVHIVGAILMHISDGWDEEKDGELTMKKMIEFYDVLREEILVWLPSIDGKQGIKLLSIAKHPIDYGLTFVQKIWK